MPPPTLPTPRAQVLPGPEAFDTAFVLLKFANGKEAAIDVCRQATYGYDQRAEVLGTKAMIQTDNTYPNTARARPRPRRRRAAPPPRRPQIN